MGFDGNERFCFFFYIFTHNPVHGRLCVEVFGKLGLMQMKRR